MACVSYVACPWGDVPFRACCASARLRGELLHWNTRTGAFNGGSVKFGPMSPHVRHPSRYEPTHSAVTVLFLLAAFYCTSAGGQLLQPAGHSPAQSPPSSGPSRENETAKRRPPRTPESSEDFASRRPRGRIGPGAQCTQELPALPSASVLCALFSNFSAQICENNVHCAIFLSFSRSCVRSERT